MAKKKATRRRRNGFTIPVAMAFPILTVGTDYVEDIQSMGFKEATRWLTGKLTGYYAQPNWPDWRAKHMKHAALPIAVGFGIHWLAGKFGINRALARTGIPILRV